MSIKIKTGLFLVLICCFNFATIISAQQIDFNKRIVLPDKDYSVSQLLGILITDYSINLSYDSELDHTEQKINLPKNMYSLKSLIDEIEKQCKSIKFITKGDNIIAKKKKYAKKLIISGFIRGETDGEALIGATVFDKNSSSGTIANEYGFYSIKTNAENANIVYSYAGYQPKELAFTITKDTVIDINLTSRHEIEEVVVKANKNEKINSAQVSKAKLDIKQTQLLPQLIGESDILKSIQLLPGVQSGTEGTGGLYIRGGSQGNNLILLDGAPVYNSNHFWGLFSVFNTESLQHVDLYKGGFPAQYGGRLSSVLDIRMKEGNNQKFSGNVGIGLISSKILFEGPIVKDKTSFILTGRRSNLDLFAEAMDFEAFKFYDVNFKINHQFSSRNRLFFSLYKSYDALVNNLENIFLDDELSYKYNMGWGNTTSTLRWNYIPTNKLFLNTTLTYSAFNTDGKSETKGVINNRYQEKTDTYISNLESKAASIDLSWFPSNKHSLKFGSKFIVNSYPFMKQKSMEKDSVLFYDETYLDTVFHANEMHAYAQYEVKLLPNLTSQIGLHASLYRIANTTFHAFEPRFTLKYEISPEWSVKTAYTEMTQYDFQRPSIFEAYRTNDGFGFKANPEIWLPCTWLLPPQRSKQVVLGTYFNFFRNFQISVEGYYTKMNHVIEDQTIKIDEIPDVWEKLFQSGNGRSYGTEILLEKKDGKVSGWIAYTLSKTERQFDNLNDGDYFPYMFDRRHNMNVVLNYNVSKKFDIGLIWDYKSGRHITLPDAQYSSAFNLYTPGDDVNDLYALSTINVYRLPAYHRLDIGLNFHKKRRRFSRTLSIGAYNAYNHHNSSIVFLDYRESDDTQEVIKSRALPVLPYISYKLKF